MPSDPLESPSREIAVPEAFRERRTSDLLQVMEVSRKLAGSSQLLPLLQAITASACKVLDCERASVFLHDPSTDELYSRVATGVDEVRFPANRGFAGEVFQSGQLINVPDAYADPRFNPAIDKATGFRTRNILTCPLRSHDNKRIGVIQVLNKRDAAFEEWDEVLVTTFGAQAGLAVERQLLLEESAKKQRIEHDLNIARKIQEGLLPKRSPKFKGYDIAGWNRPCDETGGDFYDFRELDSEKIALTLADVAGHGIGPALVVAECRALIRALVAQSDEPDVVIGLVNNLLCEDLPPDRFITAYLGIIDRAANRLTYLSAGHGPVLFYCRADDRFTELEVHGCPLGVMEDFPFSGPGVVEIGPGDILAAVTDGFFEWVDPKNEAYGIGRVQELIRSLRDEPSSTIIARLYEDVLSFAKGTPQLDDLTAVIARRVE